MNVRVVTRRLPLGQPNTGRSYSSVHRQGDRGAGARMSRATESKCEGKVFPLEGCL